MKRSLSRGLMVLLLALPLHGCGYHLVGHGDSSSGAIPADVQMLVLAGNAPAGLLMQLRQRLHSNHYAIVDAHDVDVRHGEEEQTAQKALVATLQVNIAPLAFTPSTFDGAGIATQYRMIFSGSLLLERQGETIWQSGLIQRQGDVFVSAEPTSIEASRQRLLVDLRKQWLSDAAGRLRSGF